MLANELDQLRDLSRDLAGEESQEAAFRRVTGAWQEALFSDRPDHSLRRYVNFHLQGISKISDTLFSDQPGPDLLLRLVDNLLEHFPGYVDPGCPAPAAYRRRLLARLDSSLAALSLRDFPSLAAYISEVRDGTAASPFSFRALNYLETLVTALAEGMDTDEVLLELNFNHVAYLAQRQEKISRYLPGLPDVPAKLCWLLAERARVTAAPERLGLVYHPDWPSLKTMLVSWLSEQIAALPASPAGIAKLSLDLSVAQLACLVRLCYEEGCFKETNLTAIFEQVASACTSKRQRAISPGSLSKEYYSISQVTAAVMRGKLLNMVARINKNFFPV